MASNDIATNYNILIESSSYFRKLLEDDSFIAKSNYLEVLNRTKKTVEVFSVLRDSGMLEEFCIKNGYDFKQINSIMQGINDIDKLVENHNKKYISKHLLSEKEYLDNILKDIDSNISLDENQRRVVLNDEDYCLVIAGAGAGKTTTVAAKAKYLVEKKGISPNEILIVSFTNKAVKELRDRVNKQLKLDCIISTFHSIGNAILKRETDEQLNIINDDKLYFILQDYFKNSVLKDEKLTNKLVMFFATYFDTTYEGDDLSKYLSDLAKSNFSTLKSDLNEFKKEIIDSRSKKKITIQNEIVRSYQEVEIANFLYLNSLDYEYEPIYKYNIRFSKKPYTPDFVIKQGNNEVYLEHFGITENGKNSLYSNEELEKYKRSIQDKINLHNNHKTKLIYTYSKYKDGKSILDHLESELLKNGFKLNRKNDKEVLEKIVSTEENRYVRKLITLICRFISLFKTRGCTVADFGVFYSLTDNVRDRLFLDICKECYLVYEKFLKENNAIDFQDMINNSSLILREMKNKREKLNFKYIIVDEYQDISRQRFDLVKELHEVCEAKVVAVGDDWQSIYAFSGSDIDLFLYFKNSMGYADQLVIENTYRNSQEVIDVAGNFIQKNSSQIKKTLKSPKTIKDPIIIYTYDSSRKGSRDNNKSGANYNIAFAVQTAIDDIVKYNKIDGKDNKSILLLGRFGFDGRQLDNSGLFEYIDRGNRIKSLKHPNLKITFMTAHASKGLGYDNVIIINGKNGTYGFPSKIQDDPVLRFVLKEDHSYDYAEERRLFYVAMTRTKNRVFCIAPEQYPSEFLLEIKKDYEKVVLKGTWNEEIIQKFLTKPCPMCGYPMQYKYKSAYGLRLYICTNEPEICSFMTNEYGAGKMQIMKCDKCNDGYLIAKRSKTDYFLGCTNYKDDGSGCNNTISRSKYYEMMSFVSDKPVEAKIKTVSPKKKIEKNISSINDTKLEKPTLINEIEYVEMYELSRTILSCIKHVSENKYYGETKIIKILKGEKFTDISKIDVTKIPEFGKLKKEDDKRLRLTIKWLIENKILHKTKALYPVLHITDKTDTFINKATRGQVKKLYNYVCDNINS